MFKRLLLLLFGGFLLLSAQTVSADVSVTYLETQVGGRHQVAMTVGTPLFNNPLLGIYRWQDFDGPFIYESVCIDLETLANGNPIVYQCVPLTDARAEPGLASGQLSPWRAQLLELLWGQYRSQTTSDDNAVAFHLAVYEIVYDGDSMVFGGGGTLDPGYVFPDGVFDGTDGGTSAAWAIAEGWLLALNLDGASSDLIAWKSDGQQDQITEAHFAPVPTRNSSWGQIKALYNR